MSERDAVLDEVKHRLLRAVFVPERGTSRRNALWPDDISTVLSIIEEVRGPVSRALLADVVDMPIRQVLADFADDPADIYMRAAIPRFLAGVAEDARLIERLTHFFRNSPGYDGGYPTEDEARAQAIRTRDALFGAPK